MTGSPPGAASEMPAWIEHHLGLRADDRLRARLRAAGEGARPDDLVEAAVVGETYFLRDESHCALLRDVVLPSAAAAGEGRAVEVWSAGCATGEEAYTVALLASEAAPAVAVRVLGTDVSPRAIARAVRGEYGGWSLRAVDGNRRQQWFERKGGSFAVHPRLRARVRFRVANLLDEPPERFDVVLCRNVLLYATDAAVDRIGRNLAASLRPGGWLITSACDPPLDVPSLEPVRIGDAFAYRALPTATPATPTTSAAPCRPAHTPSLLPAAPPRSQGPADRPAPQSGADVLRRATDLAAAGLHEAAIDLAELAASDSPLDAELRCLAALLHLHQRRPAAAAAAARASVCLDPDLGLAALVLGHAESALGNTDAAARSYRAAAALLGRSAAVGPTLLAEQESPAHLAAVAAQLADRFDRAAKRDAP